MRILLILSLLSVNLHGALISVCASGCDYTALQTAVSAAACGDVLEVKAGETFTTVGGLSLPNKSCTDADPYLVIRSSKGYAVTQRPTVANAASYMPLIRTSGASAPVIFVEQGASHYRFEALDIGLNTGQDTYSMVKLFFQIGGGVGDSQLSQLAHHIILDRCYIHGVVEATATFSRCIAANTGYIEFANNLITDCYAPGAGGNETQAIAGWNTRGPVYIRNNQITASQIGTLWGGAVPAIAGLRPTGIFSLGNYYYRPWKWRVTSGAADPSGTCLWDANGGEWYNQTVSVRSWRCVSGTWTNVAAGVTTQLTTLNKNQYELKNTWGSVAEGNYLANGWYPTMLNQHGACFLVNQVDNSPASGAGAVVNAYAKIQFNICDSTPWGSSNGQLGSYFYNTHDVGFVNNVFKNVGAYPQSNSNGLVGNEQEAVGFQSTTQGRYDVVNNTVVMTSTSGSRGTAFSMDSSPSNQMNYVGNIQNWANFGFYDTEHGGGGLWNAVPNQWTDWNFGLNVVPNDQTCTIYSNPCPTMNVKSKFNGSPDVLIPPMACPNCAIPASWAAVGFVNFATGDYHLDSGSAYKGKGQYALDPGADIDRVNCKTAGAISGAANPCLDFDVLDFRLSSTTGTLRYLAYDTAACTAALFPSAAYSGATFTSTSSTGDRDRTVSITGLTANTRYWPRLTCGSNVIRPEPMITSL